jgi:ligand-binding sensor domain-containing protein
MICLYIENCIFNPIMKTFALLSFFLSLLFLCSAQEYNYTNYTDRDGLAGNTVYSMCQDKDGFMWFATDGGMSRFDGTHFKNYTVADGLPDNEIIYTYCDSKGRVWMAPFKKSICYINHGTRLVEKRKHVRPYKIFLSVQVKSNKSRFYLNEWF